MWWKAVARIGLVLGSVALLSTWVFMAVDYGHHVAFLERWFSPDASISQPLMAVLRCQVFLLTLIAFLAFAVSSLGVELKDDLSGLRLRPLEWAAYLSVLIMIVASIVVRPSFPYSDPAEKLIFGEDGFFESSTAVFALAAALTLLVVAARRREQRAAAVYLTGLGALCFLYGMEEISWGQRIFDWETPTPLAEVNYQRETNVHNIFNPYLPIAATASAMILGVGVLLRSYGVKLCLTVAFLRGFEILVPPRGLILFGFLFFLGGILPIRQLPIQRDFLEYCVSVFALAYAVSLVRAKGAGDSGGAALRSKTG